MAWSFSSLLLFSFFVFNLGKCSFDITAFLRIFSHGFDSVLHTVEGKQVLEDGYEVTTVVDGHKSGLNPHTVHALPGSSNMIVLDSSGSTFYTTSFPLSVGKHTQSKPFLYQSMNWIIITVFVDDCVCESLKLYYL